MHNRNFILLTLFTSLVVLSSCSMLKPKYGCPSNGANVGAERVLSDPPKKAKKFKA